MINVKDLVAEGETIYLRGFGSFGPKKRAKKTARNISNNTTIIIPEHFAPFFKPSKVLLKKLCIILIINKFIDICLVARKEKDIRFQLINVKNV